MLVILSFLSGCQTLICFMRRLSALHLAHDAVSTLQLVHVKPELQLSQSQSVPVLALSVTTSKLFSSSLPTHLAPLYMGVFIIAHKQTHRAMQ